jgi:hypothetical protein
MAKITMRSLRIAKKPIGWSEHWRMSIQIPKSRYPVRRDSAIKRGSRSSHRRGIGTCEQDSAAGIKDAALRTATANMIALIDNAVLDVQSGSGAGDARGVTIWWGVRSDWKTYSVACHDVAFTINMNWWAFLSLYNA